MRVAQKLRHDTTNVGGWKRRDGGPMKGKSQAKVTCLCCKKTVGVNIFARFHNNLCGEVI